MRTWEGGRKGKRSRIDSRCDAVAARRVLRDAYRARKELLGAINEGDFAAWRLRWIATLTVLRAVGHVLKSVDANRSPELRDSIDAAWQRWSRDPFRHLIFHEFIKRERDTILKEYRFDDAAVAEVERSEEINRRGPFSVLLIGDQIFSVDQAVGAAIRWWEVELERIELEAGSKF